MTRVRSTHNFHEVKTLNPETACAKCGTTTPHVCEWCGSCRTCHKGPEEEKLY